MSASSDTSVYQKVLGLRFADLDPRLRVYFGPIPPGAVGAGEGTFEVAGARIALLRPVFVVLAWRRVLFPENEQEVPFSVRNERGPDGTLRAVRTFRFRRRERVMLDSMQAVEGAIVDRLGRRGGLEVRLTAAVIDGGLRLRSDRLAWRIAGRRIPLPPFAQVVVDERITDGLQRVDAVVRLRGIGTAFRYRGSFTYERR
ncbi:DUF4166 domain-containing protein [Microbacterium sp. PM5]|uniref:DUF4166 domain-containing protein n=1 Tax=Microbacterium sp. PM5 TaxID=2014534 RepID=UPI000DD10EF4|nr:DUF4166 domain-containing protein [Microbacterium sp. PM5]AXA96905.1 hypothetical protein CEP17_11075 [Microbacterium sp. PM5]